MAHTHLNALWKRVRNVTMSDHKTLTPLQTACRRMIELLLAWSEDHRRQPVIFLSQASDVCQLETMSHIMGSGLHSKLHNFFYLQFADWT